jgi:hypothetical protein
MWISISLVAVLSIIFSIDYFINTYDGLQNIQFPLGAYFILPLIISFSIPNLKFAFLILGKKISITIWNWNFGIQLFLMILFSFSFFHFDSTFLNPYENIQTNTISFLCLTFYLSFLVCYEILIYFSLYFNKNFDSKYINSKILISIWTIIQIFCLVLILYILTTTKIPRIELFTYTNANFSFPFQIILFLVFIPTLFYYPTSIAIFVIIITSFIILIRKYDKISSLGYIKFLTD